MLLEYYCFHYLRMAFEIYDFYFLSLWSAATNALIYGELLLYYNALRRPHKVTRGHWLVKCIRLLPRTGKWVGVSLGVRQQVTGLRGYGPFTYRGLVEFLTVEEDVLEELGRDPQGRQDFALQLICDMLIEPAEHLELPTTLTERNAHDLQQMRLYEQECPNVSLCRRIAKLWYRWVETKGLEYPRGVQGTWN